MIHVTCRLTAKNRDQLRNPTLGKIEYGLPFYYAFWESLEIDPTMHSQTVILIVFYVAQICEAMNVVGDWKCGKGDVGID